MNKKRSAGMDALVKHFTGPRVLNGGEMLEWWLPCDGCGGEGFYELCPETCAEEARKTGWRLKNGKPVCKDCVSSL
jgi:hypothetical protein